MKPDVIIFEGISKSGKSTLRDYLRKNNDHAYITLDRFAASMHVFSSFHEYESNIDKWLAIDERLHGIAVIVYLTVSEKRMRERNADTLYIRHYNTIKALYDLYLENTSLPVVKINTSEISINKACKKIMESIENESFCHRK